MTITGSAGSGPRRGQSFLTRFAVGLGASALVVPLALTYSAGVAGADVTTHDVPGAISLGGLGCSSATTCEAVGLTVGPQGLQGMVVPVTNGIPGTPQNAVATSVLNKIACPEAGACEAVGLVFAGDGSSEGVVVPVTNGVPGTPVLVPGTLQLSGITCTSTTACVAVGMGMNAETHLNDGEVVVIAGGVPGTARPVAGTLSLSSVACPSLPNPRTRPSETVNLSGPPFCEAVGQNGSPQGVVVPILFGLAGEARVVPGTSQLLGVDCASPLACEAVGEVKMSGTNSYEGVAVTVVLGTPGPVRPVTGTFGLVAVACPTVISCQAVGETPFPQNLGVVVPLTLGSPGPVQTIPGTSSLEGVACSAPSRCLAVGGNDGPGRPNDGVVVTTTAAG